MFASAVEPRLQRGEPSPYRPLRHHDARGVVDWPTATNTTDGLMKIDAPLEQDGSTMTQLVDDATIADSATNAEGNRRM